MANFDEKSGIVPSSTPWGTWHQTIDEVVVLVDFPGGTRAKTLTVLIKNDRVSVKRAVDDGTITIFEGPLFGSVVADESLWTLEDSNQLRMALVKTTRTPANTWRSLLKDQYEANPADFESMEKKMTLERFARENPGFDFSNADISGNFQGGGPNMGTR